MGKFYEPQILITRRATVTSVATMRELFLGLTDEFDEDTGFGTFEIAAGVGPTEIGMGSIAKGQLFFLKSDGDLSLHINGSANVSGTGTLFLQIADTTIGITSIHITNNGATNVSYERLIAGDTTP